MAKLYAIKKTRNRIEEFYLHGKRLTPNHTTSTWGRDPFAAKTWKTRDEAEAERFHLGLGGRVICLGDPAVLRSEP